VHAPHILLGAICVWFVGSLTNAGFASDRAQSDDEFVGVVTICNGQSAYDVGE